MLLTGNDLLMAASTMSCFTAIGWCTARLRTTTPVASSSPCVTASTSPHQSIRVLELVMLRRTDFKSDEVSLWLNNFTYLNTFGCTSAISSKLDGIRFAQSFIITRKGNNHGTPPHIKKTEGCLEWELKTGNHIQRNVEIVSVQFNIASMNDIGLC